MTVLPDWFRHAPSLEIIGDVMRCTVAPGTSPGRRQALVLTKIDPTAAAPRLIDARDPDPPARHCLADAACDQL